MPKITYIELTPGISILDSQCDALVNTVNCVGIMGKGVALAFKQKYGNALMVPYQRWCKEKKIYPGLVYPWKTPEGKMVLNAATKNDWRTKSEFNWIVNILCQLTLAPWNTYNLTSLALPPLGCGNGGLTWEQVGPVMAAFLEQLPLERIEVYIPTGWEQYHLIAEWDSVLEE